MTKPTLDDVFTRSPRMVGRRIGDGFVLVPIASRGVDLDGIFNLNRTAAFIWELLDGSRDGHGIVAAVSQRFEAEAGQAASDYLDLIGDLLSIAAIAPAPPLAAPGARA